MSRQRRSRIFQVAILIAITNAIVALVVATGLEKSFERWAAVFGSLSVIAPLWFWKDPGRRGASPSTPEQVDRAAAKLAALVMTAWDREVGSRLLRSPQPLAVYWKPRDDGAQGSGQNAAVRPGHMADIGPLVEDFRSCRRVVVLGPAESSKTTISILILLGLLETRQDSEPVPVLLSAATWDRDNEDLHDWLMRRLSREYPDLADTAQYGTTAIKDLVDRRRVLPVIDGVDELPARRRDRMLRALNREFPAGTWLIITCRTDEYQDAAEHSNAVTAAVVIELEPVRPGDAITFLELSAGVRRPRWRPVVELLEHDPQGDLASAFSSPLMVELARDAYGTPQADPGELTRLPDQVAIEDRLLGALIPARFGEDELEPGRGSQQDATSALRWLTFLAVHLERLNALNLAWWELRRAVPVLMRPSWRVTMFAALAGIVTGVFFGLAAGISFGVRAGLVTGIHQGLDVALVVAMAHLLASPSGPPGSGFRAALGKLPGMIGGAATSAFDRAPRIAAALICPLPYAVETGIWYGITNGTATGLRRATLDWIATACIVGLAIRMNVLVAGGGPSPYRFRLRRGRQLAGALVLGTLSGGIVGLIAGYSVMSDRSVMAQPRWSLDALAWIVVGLGFALVSWARTPTPAGQAATPASTLAGDRALVLWGLPAVILFALVYGTAFTLAPGRGLFDFLHFGAYGTGLGLALWFVVASTQAWPQYQVAVCGLAVRDRLPWRLMTFLEEAHRLRILRQDASAYQFRHARLQTYLAQNSVGAPSPAAPGPLTSAPP